MHYDQSTITAWILPATFKQFYDNFTNQFNTDSDFTMYSQIKLGVSINFIQYKKVQN